MNIKVVLLSLMGIGFVVLSFAIDWLFLIGAVVVMIINQKELMKNKGSFSDGSDGDGD